MFAYPEDDVKCNRQQKRALIKGTCHQVILALMKLLFAALGVYWLCGAEPEAESRPGNEEEKGLRHSPAIGLSILLIVS
jgi:hypothetical protein